MGSDEIVFTLPGRVQHTDGNGHEIDTEVFPLTSLDQYDEIFRNAIRDWEANVKRGTVALFLLQGSPRGQRPISLGEMAVEDAKAKFGREG